MTNKISNLIKILTGRKLSEIKMELSKKGRKSFANAVLLSGDSKVDNFYNLFFDGKNFIELTTKYKLEESPRLIHKEFTPYKSTKKVYNEHGLLKSKEICLFY